MPNEKARGDSVDVTSLANQRMARNWFMIESILGGTETMRNAGKTLLPAHPRETEENYNHRLQRATFSNYYKGTIQHLTGKAFAKPLVLKDDVPENLVKMCEDVDTMGTHINAFAASVFFDALAWGGHAILVDYPTIPQGLNLEQERKIGARPYFVSVPIRNVLGVRMDPVNHKRLIEARILETATEQDGLYGEKEVKQIRVIRPDDFEIWRMDESSKGPDGKATWALRADLSGKNSLGEVALVPVYGKKMGAWYMEPPLLDLAYLNVAHWQSASDQRNILTVARFPMLAASGWSSDDPTIEIGPKKLLTTADPSGRFYYVEHGGAAISAGRQDLEDLKAEMATAGLQMFMPVTNGPEASATESEIKYAESTSALQMMAFSLKDSLENALAFMAKWENPSAENGGSIDIQGSFAMPRNGSDEISNLLALQSAGTISRKTLYSELVRRGFLSDDFDPEKESEIIEAEAPTGAAGGMFGKGKDEE